MQQDHEQNREPELRRRSSGESDEGRGFRSGSREQYENRGYGEQGGNFGQEGRNFGREDRNIVERGGRSFRDDNDVYLGRDRSGGQGQSRRAYQAGQRFSAPRGQDRGVGRSPYGEGQQNYGYGGSAPRGGYYGGEQEREYPYRARDYRDYGYGGSDYDRSAAYEGRGYGPDYDFEGRGGFENRGGFDDQGYRGSGMQSLGGYGNREPYESRAWGGGWTDEGGVSEWTQRGGTREAYSNIFDNERGGSGGQRFGGRGQVGAGQVVGRSRSETGRSFRGMGPKGYSRSDESIHEEVCQRLEDADFDPSDVTVSVENGEVRLSGSIDSRWAKRYAEDIAYQIRGVSDVYNELRVESGEEPRPRGEGRRPEEQRGNGRSSAIGASSEQQRQ